MENFHLGFRGVVFMGIGFIVWTLRDFEVDGLRMVLSSRMTGRHLHKLANRVVAEIPKLKPPQRLRYGA